MSRRASLKSCASRCLWLSLAAAFVSTGAKAEAPQSAASPPEVDVSWLKIPMRDGIHLGSVLYRPSGATAPLPVILSLTPYTADSLHPLGIAFARRGYAFAATDVRGRGESEGVLEPWRNDGRDGHDAAHWLARQPWSNGQVVVLGHSYGGRAVWSTLKEGPESLVAGVPVSASLPMVTWKNLVGVDMVQWLFQNRGAALHARLAFDPELWTAKLRRLYVEHLPFRQLDSLLGARNETFQRMLDHPTADAFWTSIVPAPADYARLRQPILIVTGAYDTPEPSLHYFRDLERHASAEQRRRTYLIVGPWDHPGALRPQREFAGISIGPAGVIDMPELIAGWLDASLRDGALPPFFRMRIAYYVLGAEEWRYAETLEEIAGARSTLYLDSPAAPAGKAESVEGGPGGGAQDLTHAGVLVAARPSRRPADTYVYDPLDTRPGLAQQEEPAAWITDATPALTLAGNGLVYEGEPFAEEVEIAGAPRFVAWISMDVPDTDFVAGLYLIAPDGGSVLLGEDYLRARYRRSLEREDLVRPGAIERYDFELPFHVRRCPRGSRLRLLLRSPNSLYLEKNYNAGGVVAEESGKDARTAHVTLHHDAAHRSYLELPLARRK